MFNMYVNCVCKVLVECLENALFLTPFLLRLLQCFTLNLYLKYCTETQIGTVQPHFKCTHTHTHTRTDGHTQA